MSLQHTVTTTWTDGSNAVKAVRKVTADNAGELDLYVPPNFSNVSAAFGLLLAKARLVVILADQPATLSSGGVDARQTLTAVGPPTGGTFTLTFGGNTTAAINWNATAAQVQAALAALPSIGAGFPGNLNLVCSGGPLPGTPVVCEFTGALGLQPVTLMTHTDSLVGGTMAVATTIAGVLPDTTFALVPTLPLVWDALGYFAQPFAADVVFLHGSAGAAGANIQVRTLSVA